MQTPSTTEHTQISDLRSTIENRLELLVYPPVEPTEEFFEILPLLSGEMASFFRGRGVELHSIREYQYTDSARQVDWKATAKTGGLKVREFTREDERRVMLIFARTGARRT